MLPFLVPRLFRPLMLNSWNLTNTDIGAAFSVYGITAMGSYFVGGPLADRFPPRMLISLSVALTAVAGLGVVLAPSATHLLITYGVFGVSTTLLMWGALIRVTHVTGGELNRSTAMGILDAVRGLTAALAGSGLVLLVTGLLPNLETSGQQSHALRIIYFAVIAFNLAVAALVWISGRKVEVGNGSGPVWSLSAAVASLRDGQVWLLGVTVLSAYCGYKSIDNYSIYIADVMGKSPIEASAITTAIIWLRPLAALAAGVLADRFKNRWHAGRFFCLFFLLAVSSALQVVLSENLMNVAIIVILLSATFAYSLRAVYFAVFGDLGIGENVVGTTVGLVSVVGFLPDFFFGYVTGRLVDAHPGALGFKYSFLFTTCCLAFGAAASFVLFQRSMRSDRPRSQMLVRGPNSD